MAKIQDQSIPSELQDAYDGTLNSREWMTGAFKACERRRFRIPTLQGCRTIRAPIPRGSGVTDPMCLHREIFGKCVKCFNAQPKTGGAEPPDVGPRNREWWYNEAEYYGMWYYNFFMQETLYSYTQEVVPEWCRTIVTKATYVDSMNPYKNYNNELSLKSQQVDPPHMIIFMKDEENEFDRVYMWVKQVSCNPPPKPLCWHGVFKVPDEFDVTKIKYFNMPDLGDLVSQTYVPTTTKWNWISFYKGDLTQFAIKMITGYGAFWATSEYLGGEHSPYFAP